MFLTKFPLTAKYAKFTARTKNIFTVMSTGFPWGLIVSNGMLKLDNVMRAEAASL